jgi:hypothetical protein
MNRKVWSEQLASLPEAVQRCDDGAREEPLQYLLHKGDLCLGDGGLVAQVSHLPGPEIRTHFFTLPAKHRYISRFTFILRGSGINSILEKQYRYFLSSFRAMLFRPFLIYLIVLRHLNYV